MNRVRRASAFAFAPETSTEAEPGVPRSDVPRSCARRITASGPSALPSSLSRERNRSFGTEALLPAAGRLS